jgi:hypothetical protein
MHCDSPHQCYVNNRISHLTSSYVETLAATYRQREHGSIRGLWAGRPRDQVSIPGMGKRFLSVATTAHPASSYSWGVKWPWREADRSRSSGAEINNMRIYTTPLLYVT